MIVTAGSTGRHVYFYIQEDAGATNPGEPVTALTSTDLDSASYARAGAARTAITLSSTLASASAGWTSGGFIKVDDTNMAGTYRLDVPDAAFATGVDQVIVQVDPGAARVCVPVNVDVTDVDLRDAVSGGMTRLDAAITTRLAPTTTGRTLDCSTGGAAGINWGNVENSTASVDLSQTSMDLVDTCSTNTDMRGTNSVVLSGPTKAEMDTAHALLSTPAQVATALTDIDLDHLINVSVADEVADDSIIAKMVDRTGTADWSSFIHTEDSLRAISEEVSAIGSASGGGFNFAPVGANALSASINNGGAAVDKSTTPATVGIPVTGHAFLAGHEVTLSLTVAYNATFVIDSVTANEVVIVSAFTAETFGPNDLIRSTIKTDYLEGVETSGTFASVSGQDGVRHVIDDDGGNNFTIAYRFEVGGDRLATEAVFTGFLNGGNDNALIQAYDFVGDAWETRRQFDGQGGSVNQTVVVPLLARNTGTDATDIGVVFLRVTDGASSSNPTLNTDSFLVEAIGIGQSAGYQNGQIWLDTVGGTDAAVKFVNGTSDKPVKTIANVVSLVATGLSPDVHVLNGSSFTLAASAAGYSFFGDNWTLALGGQDIAGAHFEGAEISGTGTGADASYKNCHFDATTLASGELFDCGLADTLTFSAATDYVIVDGFHEELGAPATVDFGSAVGATEAHIHGWKGALLVRNMDTGDILHFSSSNGTLELDSSNTAGTLNISGTPKLTNNSTGMTTNDNRDQALILADTSELQTDWADGGRLDAILDLTALEATVAALNDFDPALDTVALVTLVTTVTNNSDMRGTDSAALASVLGALNDGAAAGDVTTVDTVMQYIKQALNEISGSVGIGTMPSAADPANGINLFEMLRAAMGATFATSTDSLEQLESGVGGIPTTAMRGTDSAALASVATEARLAELDAGNLPTDIAAIPTTAMRGTDSAALASVATETRLAELDAGNLPTDIAAIPTTAMRGTDSAALASVATEARLAELDAANMPADLDIAVLGALTAATKAKLDAAALGIVSSSAKAGTLSTTQMSTNLTEATNDHYIGRTIIWTSGVLLGQASDVTDYVGTNGVLTFTAVTEAPSASDTFVMV